MHKYVHALIVNMCLKKLDIKAKVFNLQFTRKKSIRTSLDKGE